MRKNKYNAKKTFCKQGHKHDSRTEAARCDELHEQQDAGLISNLQVHKKYTLLGAQKYPGGTKNERCITYTPDFVYEKNGIVFAEDVKGMGFGKKKTKKQKMPPEYIIKRKLFKFLFCKSGDVQFLETGCEK
mgnify:FL=1